MDVTPPHLPQHVWISKFKTPLTAEDSSAAGLLAGMTFAVKDNIDVANHVTTAGCKEFAFEAKTSATVVSKLMLWSEKLI
jgi:allophanate hydrolase